MKICLVILLCRSLFVCANRAPRSFTRGFHCRSACQCSAVFIQIQSCGCRVAKCRIAKCRITDCRVADYKVADRLQSGRLESIERVAESKLRIVELRLQSCKIRSGAVPHSVTIFQKQKCVGMQLCAAVARRFVICDG